MIVAWSPRVQGLRLKSTLVVVVVYDHRHWYVVCMSAVHAMASLVYQGVRMTLLIGGTLHVVLPCCTASTLLADGCLKPTF